MGGLWRVSSGRGRGAGAGQALGAHPDDPRPPSPGYAAGDRERARRPSLIRGGARAGESRVRFAAAWRVGLHAWLRDFFVSALHLSLGQLLLGVAAVYLAIFFIFAGVWWAVWAGDERCLSASAASRRSFGTAFIFSVATTQTIGYGNTAPNDCGPAYVVLVVQVGWGRGGGAGDGDETKRCKRPLNTPPAPSPPLSVQTLVAIVTEAIVIGVIFARISHPQHRARTIGISTVAVVARRDGILKLQFRVADFQSTQVVEPKVKAFLYTWGAGRTTAEGRGGGGGAGGGATWRPKKRRRRRGGSGERVGPRLAPSPLQANSSPSAWKNCPSATSTARSSSR